MSFVLLHSACNTTQWNLECHTSAASGQSTASFITPVCDIMACCNWWRRALIGQSAGVKHIARETQGRYLLIGGHGDYQLLS